MRITLDIDDAILSGVMALREKQGRSMGTVVSELLAETLARRQVAGERPPFHWISRDMKPLVDIFDKEAIVTDRS